MSYGFSSMGSKVHEALGTPSTIKAPAMS